MHKIRRAGFLLLAIFVLFGLASQAALASSSAGRPLVVILADRQAVAQTDGGADLAKSFLGLISTLREGELFAFITVDNPTEVIGPVAVGGPEFKWFQEQVDARLASTDAPGGLDAGMALVEAYNFLSGELAPRGSTVYLVSGGAPRASLDGAASRLTPVLRLFKEKDWPIVGVTLPGAAAELRSFVNSVSRESGGEWLELSVPDGLKRLADLTLRDQAKGSWSELDKGMLSPSDILTSTLSIAPGTREATLVFFKEGAYGSLRLSNPSGFEASAGDRAVSSVVETPHVVIWKLLNPAPGQWKVEVRGLSGVVSAWHHVVNKYRINLESSGPVPINAPSTLIASVNDEQQRAALEGVKLTARLTTPEGATLVHELNDSGTSGDAVAGDGYFSATIPPLASEGQYRVDLELAWPEFGHRVSSRAELRAAAFPVIELTPVRTQELRPGERAHVATLSVKVNGHPYATSLDELTTGEASNVDQAGLLEVKPRELLEQGRAWLYDVFFTPKQEGGLHTVIFGLNLKYEGQQYAYSTDSMVLASVQPAPAVQPAPPAPAAPAPQPQTLPPQVTVEPPGFPWGLLAIPAALVLALMASGLYWLVRTRPYGYLYSDRNELVVDFTSLKRNPFLGFLFKNSVGGKELALPGFEGVWFRFFGRRVDLRSRQVAPTVRVNNQPLIGDKTIQDRTWIGAHGKIYTFTLTPPSPRASPSAGDDGS
jgi:hypothetical protein